MTTKEQAWTDHSKGWHWTEKNEEKQELFYAGYEARQATTPTMRRVEFRWYQGVGRVEVAIVLASSEEEAARLLKHSLMTAGDDIEIVKVVPHGRVLLLP